MKSELDFENQEQYMNYLRAYYAGIAMNAYMVGNDWKNINTVYQIKTQSIIMAENMVRELFNKKFELNK